MAVHRYVLADLQRMLGQTGGNYQAAVNRYLDNPSNPGHRSFVEGSSWWQPTLNEFMRPHQEAEAKRKQQEQRAAQQKAEHDRRMAEQQRQAAEQRARAEAEQKRIEAENQRIAQETARRENYGRAMRSGDLAGDDTAPTVISGGTQNVDQSRLSIGGSSRRRRGRGISSQLGL